ncbi:MAG TPA: FAD-dependent oxidoreductase [Gaiellaceae bacterium]|nr:FAD-dependent oxidoreductase [Gaiellaceae bacterium]
MRSAVVVGAGIFGGSLALRLVSSGWDVTLVEQYPPGHVRAASGGESRLIRFSHGTNDWYTRSARRALDLWRELERETGTELFVPSGVAWFFTGAHGWDDASERVLSEQGIAVERLGSDEGVRLFPSFDARGLDSILLEPEAGLLRARDATRVTSELAIERGARFVTGKALPDGDAVLVDANRLEGDRVVWAGGAWLAALFPELVDLRVTRQDVYFFGAPAGWQAPSVPGWVDFDNGVYGLGDLDGRGFKASPDREGPTFDPDRGERTASDEKEREAREYLALRFPALAGAPLVGTRSCPYSLTEDTNFLIAPHPEHEHVWLLGGGSGHGFKHGPALAEYVGKLLDGSEEPDPMFALDARSPGGGLRAPWIER